MKSKIFNKNTIGITILLSLVIITSFSKGTPKKAYREDPITVRVAGDRDHPPYEYIDESGNYKGFNVDIMNALSIELGLDIELIPMKWSDALAALENKEVDAIQGISKTEERLKKFLFSTPTVINSQAIFVLKETSIISDIKDLSNVRVSFQYGDINHDKIKEIPGVIMVAKQNQEEAMNALLNRESEAYLGNKLTGLYYLQKSKKTFMVKTVGDQMETFEYGPATYLGNEELTMLFSQGIESLRKNGTYDKIYAKWFGEEIAGGLSLFILYLRESIIAIGTVISVFILFIIWNKKLKKEVEKRTIDLKKANEDLLNQQAKIHNLAYYDAVTSLPNRLYLMESLSEIIQTAEKENTSFAVLNLDLDRFKHINDTLGHDMGDRILELAGKRISDVINKCDIFARIGGDEFIILILNIKTIDEVINMANKIIEEFHQPFLISEYQLFITTSIGISIYPNCGKDPTDLIKNSDIAMYVAKNNGGNGYFLYTDELSKKEMKNMVLINQLRRAIKNEDFVIYYQPIIEVKTNKLIGMEALIRWQKPDEGIVPPMTFIPLAEETGLILPIGEWVLRNACIQNKKWIDRGFKERKVYVNISARQFSGKNFFERVVAILDETGLKPQNLGLEITESTAILDVEYTIEIFNKLKGIGVSIAMDDFGTGYSSFSCLKDMKVDVLKIDRSFTVDNKNDPRDRAIAKTIILLGHQLGLSVTAEGVETEEQLQFLVENNCDRAQGYLYTKPIPAIEFEKFLD